ncbi:MAG: hypothetical protein ACI959_000151 [Limisphaerales bacterium]|jgi:hypothetical protein
MRVIFSLLAIVLSFAAQQVKGATISGELQKWHTVTLTFDGPWLCENSSTNPFLNYRLNVTFSSGPIAVTVPGFFAADGDASESSADCGDKWQVRFSPPKQGTWTYTVEFRTGSNIAIEDWAGSSTHFDGETGNFHIAPSDKTGVDLRGKGLLKYVNQRYLRFAENREHMVFGGSGSPENFLAYGDFDGTFTDPDGPNIDNIHAYVPHIGDWSTGDPVWQSTKGKGIIGAVNYLSSVGMNIQYFLTFNEGGDGDDVWPWNGPENYDQFDVSKLEQWEILFEHMQAKGIVLHMLLQEQENDQFLNGGNLYDERKLYYRELVARFAHHPGIIWNLGEENTNSDWQRKQHASYIRDLDVYDHLILTHTYPFDKNSVYYPLLGYDDYDGASLQISSQSFVPTDTEEWVNNSASNGKPWVVLLSEIGPATDGVVPDINDPNHDDIRKWFLWVHLMCGGAGTEWYFGYNYTDNDLNCEDFRSRDNMWEQTKHALDLWKMLPLDRMDPRNDLVSRYQTYCFAMENKVYVVHLPDDDWTDLTLGTGNFRHVWYDPRVGGGFIDAGLFTMTAPGIYKVENPPTSWQDWVAVIWKPGAAGSSRLDVAAGPASVTVSPNPASDFAMIELPQSANKHFVYISDASGKVVLSKQFSSGNAAQINTSALSTGMYFFRVIENEGLIYTGNFEVIH